MCAVPQRAQSTPPPRQGELPRALFVQAANGYRRMETLAQLISEYSEQEQALLDAEAGAAFDAVDSDGDGFIDPAGLYGGHPAILHLFRAIAMGRPLVERALEVGGGSGRRLTARACSCCSCPTPVPPHTRATTPTLELSDPSLRSPHSWHQARPN